MSWLARLLCRHEWEHVEFFSGWAIVPETAGWQCTKELRECQKCGKREARQR